MSLQFISGGAGSGKSTYLYQKICEEAVGNPAGRFFVIVPEQFTLETQKTLVKLSDKKGIMNIDVLSFNRLAYRVFEEFPALKKTILEDMGKTMVLKKILSQEKKNLVYFGRGIDKPGFLDELKSFLCELFLYGIDETGMEEMISAADTDSLTEYKLKDLKRIYLAFRDYMADEYMTAEEILPQLCKVVHEVEMLKDSVFAFDGFTGFTPVQYELLTELLRISNKIYVTLDIDGRGKREELFRLTFETMRTMGKICKEQGVTMEEPVILGKGKDFASYRFKENGALSFLERNLFSSGYTKFTEKQDEISITAVKNPKEESDFVARKIWWLVAKEGYRYQDIAVVTGDLNQYQEYLGARFEELGIRYFIDNKKSIGGNALSEFVLSFLEMLRKDMDYDSTIRFLRCGLSPLTREETDQMENVILALGKRGFHAYEKEWKTPYHGENRYDMESVNASRQKLTDMISNARNAFAGGKKTVSEYVEILYHFIADNRIYEKLKEKVAFFEERHEVLLAKEYKSVYGVMMDLFDQMVELLGDEEISFAGFKELLGAGISEGFVGFTPPAMDQVVVGDVERSRLKDIKVLFFVGVNDGVVPKSLGAPGILSEKERESFKENNISLAPGAKEKIFTDQYYMYLNLAKPSHKLYLTYSKTGDDGDSLRPSYLIARLKKLFAEDSLTVKVEDEGSTEKLLGTDLGLHAMLLSLSDYENRWDDKRFMQLFSYYMKKDEKKMNEEILPLVFQKKKETNLSKEAVKLLYGEELSGSVTRLENFRKCPFAHFLTYGLCLSKRQEFEIANMDFGNIFHASLENFSKMLSESGKKWRDVGKKDIHNMVNACVEKAAENYKDSVFEQSMRSKYVIYRIHRIMGRTIETMVEQMKRGDFEQSAYEISFQALNHLEETHIQLEDGREMNLHGRIDRIDTIETKDNTFVRVIDYKTGATEFELTSFYYGLQMQLVVYLETAMALEKRKSGKEPVPAGMYYYHVKDPMLSVYEQDDEKRKEMFMKELALDGFAVADQRADTTPPGVLAKKKNLLTEKEIRGMISHTRKRMCEFGNEILKGNKEIKPYKLGTKTGCDYCEYQSICRFDEKKTGDSYQYFEKLKAEEVWGKINE